MLCSDRTFQHRRRICRDALDTRAGSGNSRLADHDAVRRHYDDLRNDSGADSDQFRNLCRHTGCGYSGSDLRNSRMHFSFPDNCAWTRIRLLPFQKSEHRSRRARGLAARSSCYDRICGYLADPYGILGRAGSVVHSGASRSCRGIHFRCGTVCTAKMEDQPHIRDGRMRSCRSDPVLDHIKEIQNEIQYEIKRFI